MRDLTMGGKRKKSVGELNGFEPVNLTLTRRGKEILELLGAGNPPYRVAAAVGVTKPAITYWIKKLNRLGYLRLQRIDVYHTYALTYLGSKVLTGSEESRRVIVLEDYSIKYGVVEWENVPVRWEKLGHPRNWVKLGFKVGRIRVVKTSRSVIIHPGQLRGFDPYELVYVAGRQCDHVARWLQNHLGMVLQQGEPIKRPTFQVYDRLAEEVTQYFSFKGDVGGADRSPPSRKGHWELDLETAKDYILSFGRLKEVVRELRNMSKRLDNIESGMLPALDVWLKVGNRLLEVLSKFESHSLELQNPKEEGDVDVE